ncbi:MAG: autotransporter-associated beta strand repeat-containing protein [Pirellulales bacterium]
MTKVGTGTLTLSGNSTSSGALTVNAGILISSGTFNNGAGTTAVGNATGTVGLLYVPSGSYSTTSVTLGSNSATSNGIGSIVVRGGSFQTTSASASAGISYGSTGAFGRLRRIIFEQRQHYHEPNRVPKHRR